MSNFSGFISTLGLPYTQNDILSKIIYNNLTYNHNSGTILPCTVGHVIIGGLLIQFSTTRVLGNSIITLPVSYPTASSNWTHPFIVFFGTLGNDTASVIEDANYTTNTFNIDLLSTTYTYWITIGPVPP
jgi:hypothetical protein